MKKYALGFAFSQKLDKVLLIKKSEDCYIEHLRGRLNGCGGHIEEHEPANLAMAREFSEETGIYTESRNWRPFACLYGKLGGDGEKFEMYLFYIVTDDIFNFKQMEKEELDVYGVIPNYFRNKKNEDIYFENYSHVSNISWLIPMALNHARNLDSCSYFEIYEN